MKAFIIYPKRRDWEGVNRHLFPILNGECLVARHDRLFPERGFETVAISPTRDIANVEVLYQEATEIELAALSIEFWDDYNILLSGSCWPSVAAADSMVKCALEGTPRVHGRCQSAKYGEGQCVFGFSWGSAYNEEMSDAFRVASQHHKAGDIQSSSLINLVGVLLRGKVGTWPGFPTQYSTWNEIDDETTLLTHYSYYLQWLENK